MKAILLLSAQILLSVLWGLFAAFPWLVCASLVWLIVMRGEK